MTAAERVSIRLNEHKETEPVRGRCMGIILIDPYRNSPEEIRNKIRITRQMGGFAAIGSTGDGEMGVFMEAIRTSRDLGIDPWILPGHNNQLGLCPTLYYQRIVCDPRTQGIADLELKFARTRASLTGKDKCIYKRNILYVVAESPGAAVCKELNILPLRVDNQRHRQHLVRSVTEAARGRVEAILLEGNSGKVNGGVQVEPTPFDLRGAYDIYRYLDILNTGVGVMLGEGIVTLDDAYRAALFSREILLSGIHEGADGTQALREMLSAIAEANEARRTATRGEVGNFIGKDQLLNF